MMSTNAKGNVAIYILIALLVGVLFGGGFVYWCSGKQPVPAGSITTITPEPLTGTPTPTPVVLATIDPTLSRTYVGLLPCASCEGIETELTLSQAGPAAAEGTFVLKEKYVGEKDGLFQATGLWTTLRGTPTDVNATVIQLNPDKVIEARYYLKVSDTEIKLLDNEQREIKSPLNYSLKTKDATPSLSAEAQKLVGVWRSTQDTKYTREFKAEGTVIDKYEGNTSATQSGVWSQVIDIKTLPTPLPTVGNATFMSVVFGQETFYYTVGATSTADHLVLIPLSGKNILDFTRVK